MGRGLARNMVAKGIDLSFPDLDAQRVEELISAGAKACANTGEMAASVVVLMVCVATAEAVQQLTPESLAHWLQCLLIACLLTTPRFQLRR